MSDFYQDEVAKEMLKGVQPPAMNPATSGGYVDPRTPEEREADVQYGKKMGEKMLDFVSGMTAPRQQVLVVHENTAFGVATAAIACLKLSEFYDVLTRCVDSLLSTDAVETWFFDKKGGFIQYESIFCATTEVQSVLAQVLADMRGRINVLIEEHNSKVAIAQTATERLATEYGSNHVADNVHEKRLPCIITDLAASKGPEANAIPYPLTPQDMVRKTWDLFFPSTLELPVEMPPILYLICGKLGGLDMAESWEATELGILIQEGGQDPASELWLKLLGSARSIRTEATEQIAAEGLIAAKLVKAIADNASMFRKWLKV